MPFDSPDGKPVSLLFVLLVPEQATEQHLQILSELAQRFSDHSCRDAISAAYATAAQALRQLAALPPARAAPMRQFSIAQLYEDHREKLQLNWIAARDSDRQLVLKETGNYGADVIGHLNLIHAERLRVIGQAEFDWANRVSPKRLTTQIAELIAENPAGHDLRRWPGGAADHPRSLRGQRYAAVHESEAMLGGDRPAAHLSCPPPGRYDLGAWRVHGCARMGVLITGDSGVGKSNWRSN